MSNYLDAIKMGGEYGLKNFSKISINFLIKIHKISFSKSKTVLSNLVEFVVFKNRLTKYGQICHVCVCRGLKIYQTNERI